MATNNLVNGKRVNSQKPEILINIDAEESILTSPGKKLNSIIKNISNFIFTFQDDSLTLPRYNQDVVINSKDEECKNIEEVEKNDKNVQIFDIENAEAFIINTEVNNKSDYGLARSIFLNENNISIKEKKNLFPKWDLEAQKYSFK